MTVPELLLAIYAAGGGLFLAAFRRPGRSMWRAIAIAGAVLSIANVVSGGHRTEAVPMTIIASFVALLAFRRSRWKAAPPPRLRRILSVVLRYIAALLVAFVVVLDAAFIEFLDPLTNAPIEELLSDTEPLDLSQFTWPAAFEKLNDHFSRAYALGQWKRIDWKALHAIAAPKIAEAARTGDRAMYYRVLREYVWSLSDGHVNLSGHDNGLRSSAINGGYGMVFIRLDDGRTISHVLTESGPAAQQGMKWGATILQWNDVAIDDAAAETPLIWNYKPPATNESRRLVRLRLLTRAPVGTNATVAFQNPGEERTRRVTLVAVNDGLATLRLDGLPQSSDTSDTNIEWRMLPDGIGYVRIREEVPVLSQLLPYRVMQRAVVAFINAGAKGVVVDVRGNTGGADKLVPSLMGFFVESRQFYEHATFFDESTLRFERQAAGTLWTEPRWPHFSGPVAILIDEWCFSSCEGFPLIALRRSGGHVVGFHGTSGSFGMSGAEVRMPDGLTVHYPNGQSLDENGIVQLDSDWRLEGGVAPDIRVPLTFETVREQFKEGRDVVLETAVRTIHTLSRN